MTSQNIVANRFAQGRTGTASNVKVVEHEWGCLMLVGYGHAIYAYRFPSGFIITFKGWYRTGGAGSRSGSQSTKTQFGKMGLTSMADEVVTNNDVAPSKSNFEPHEWEYLKQDEPRPTPTP